VTENAVMDSIPNSKDGVGTLALVGSGEFTPAMEEVDRALLEGRPGRVVFLPTAAAPEGEERLRYWVELGSSHYHRLGVEAVPLMVRTRDDADNEELAAQLSGAGLIYLSGGNPGFLADTLHDTPVGEAVKRAWEAGAAVAGCSAGAMALTEYAPNMRDRMQPPTAGLGFVTDVVVLPHFDRMEQWLPGATELAVASAPAGYSVLGIEEETAVVGGPVDWLVAGRRSAWLLRAGGDRRRFGSGDRLSLGDADAHLGPDESGGTQPGR
jgi:cyanophycinase-like exopeptidase